MADPLSLNNMAQALPVVSPVVRAPALPPLAVMFGAPPPAATPPPLPDFSVPIAIQLTNAQERVRRLEHELDFQKRKNEETVALLNDQSVAAALTISSMVASKENFHFIVDVSSTEYGELKLEAENTAAKLSTAKKQQKVLTLKSKIDIKTGQLETLQAELPELIMQLHIWKEFNAEAEQKQQAQKERNKAANSLEKEIQKMRQQQSALRNGSAQVETVSKKRKVEVIESDESDEDFIVEDE